MFPSNFVDFINDDDAAAGAHHAPATSAAPAADAADVVSHLRRISYNTRIRFSERRCKVLASATFFREECPF